jgi:hypothetical protein
VWSVPARGSGPGAALGSHSSRIAIPPSPPPSPLPTPSSGFLCVGPLAVFHTSLTLRDSTTSQADRRTYSRGSRLANCRAVLCDGRADAQRLNLQCALALDKAALEAAAAREAGAAEAGLSGDGDGGDGDGDGGDGDGDSGARRFGASGGSGGVRGGCGLSDGGNSTLPEEEADGGELDGADAAYLQLDGCGLRAASVALGLSRRERRSGGSCGCGGGGSGHGGGSGASSHAPGHNAHAPPHIERNRTGSTLRDEPLLSPPPGRRRVDSRWSQASTAADDDLPAHLSAEQVAEAAAAEGPLSPGRVRLELEPEEEAEDEPPGARRLLAGEIRPAPPRQADVRVMHAG